MTTVHSVSNVVDIALLTYQREENGNYKVVYLSPALFNEYCTTSYNDRDDEEDQGYDGNEYFATKSYYINDKDIAYPKFEEYSNKIVEKSPRNEYPFAIPFNVATGASHRDNDTKYEDKWVTQWYYLKNINANFLTDVGFTEFTGMERWVAEYRGASSHTWYWRVFYRTEQGYIEKLKCLLFTNYDKNKKCSSYLEKPENLRLLAEQCASTKDAGLFSNACTYAVNKDQKKLEILNARTNYCIDDRDQDLHRFYAGSNNWKYTKDPKDPECLKDWTYYDADKTTILEKDIKHTTLINGSGGKSWCATNPYISASKFINNSGAPWKYTNNPKDPDCLNNWKYYTDDGKKLYNKKKPIENITTINGGGKSWCATKRRLNVNRLITDKYCKPLTESTQTLYSKENKTIVDAFVKKQCKADKININDKNVLDFCSCIIQPIKEKKVIDSNTNQELDPYCYNKECGLNGYRLSTYTESLNSCPKSICVQNLEMENLLEVGDIKISCNSSTGDTKKTNNGNGKSTPATTQNNNVTNTTTNNSILEESSKKTTENNDGKTTTETSKTTENGKVTDESSKTTTTPASTSTTTPTSTPTSTPANDKPVEESYFVKKYSEIVNSKDFNTYASIGFIFILFLILLAVFLRRKKYKSRNKNKYEDDDEEYDDDDYDDEYDDDE